MSKDEKAIVKIPDSENLLVFSDAMVKSDMFPNVKSKFGAAAIIQYGIELGLPPVVALQTMCVISGKICMEAKAMLALAIKGGVTHKIVKKTKEGSQVTFSRKGQEPYTETFTIKDAEGLGFLGKSNWRQFPEEMCYWRCISKGLRAFAPDVIMGIYAKEEMEEVKGFSETTEVEEIKKEAVGVEEIKDAEVVAEEDEKVEEELAKEEKPKKKKPKPKVKEVIPDEPEPEPEPEQPEEEQSLLSDEQLTEAWRLLNLLVDKYKRSPGDLDDKLRARLKIDKKRRIPNDLTPEIADAVINILLASVENERQKTGV